GSLAGDLGRDALHDLAGRARIDQHVEFRLTQQVDEARRHDQIRRVDLRLRLGVRETPDRRNPIARYTDVTAKPRRSGPVDDATVRNQNVKTRPLREGDRT